MLNEEQDRIHEYTKVCFLVEWCFIIQNDIRWDRF